MYIPQAHLHTLERLTEPGKVVVLYGARRVGKTTLVRRFQETRREDVLFVTGEDLAVRQYLESQSVEKLRAFVGESHTLIIDEAQYVKHIGLNLKLLVDHVPGLRIVATGSSSFDLARDAGAPLAGRQYTLRLFPLAQLELANVEPRHETSAKLEMRLIYGSYPEVIVTGDNRKRERYLQELVSAYLFKDLLELEDIRHADKLTRLLQLLAFQVGREVSITELGSQLGMGKNTVERYLDLLEKVFIIYRLGGFSRNLRKEVTKSCRYYFVDNGVRNALIRNFNPLDLRDDTGALWENYVIGERLKYLEYRGQGADVYFWRTYDRKEIDLVEERGGQLCGYEIKWGPRDVRPPRDWVKAYPEARFRLIHRENYLDFIV